MKKERKMSKKGKPSWSGIISPTRLEKIVRSCPGGIILGQTFVVPLSRVQDRVPSSPLCSPVFWFPARDAHFVPRGEQVA